MGRLNTAIESGAYAASAKSAVLDLRHGGQNGYAPNLSELTSNAAHVTQQLHCIMLEPPKLFTVLRDSQKWIGALRAMFEVHSKTIEGFDATLTVETDEHQIGGSSEVQQEFTRVTRARSEPKHGYVDKYGRPIQRLHEFWIRYGLQDPEARRALLGTLGIANVTDLLPDWYTCTNLYYVPDALGLKIDKAWLTAGIYPLSAGDNTARRDLTASNEMLNLDIPYAGVSQVGSGVDDLAQEILDGLRITNADPYMRAAFMQEIAPSVRDVTNANGGAVGYGASVAAVRDTSVGSAF